MRQSLISDYTRGLLMRVGIIMLAFSPLFFIPAEGVPSVFVSTAELTLLVWVASLFFLLTRRSLSLPRLVFWGAGSFLVTLLASAFAGPAPYHSFFGDGVEWISVLGLGTGIIALIVGSTMDVRTRDRFLWASICVGVFASVIHLLGIVFGVIIGSSNSFVGSMIGTFLVAISGSYSFAVYFLVLACVSVGMLLHGSQNEFRKRFLVASILISLVLAVFHISNGESRPTFAQGFSHITQTVQNHPVLGYGVGEFATVWRNAKIDTDYLGPRFNDDRSQSFSFFFTLWSVLGLLGVMVSVVGVVVLAIRVRSALARGSYKDMYREIGLVGAALIIIIGAVVVPFSYGLYLFACVLLGTVARLVPGDHLELPLPRSARVVYAVCAAFVIMYTASRLLSLSMYAQAMRDYQINNNAASARTLVSDAFSVASYDYYSRTLAQLSLGQAENLLRSSRASTTDEELKKQYLNYVAQGVVYSKQAIAYNPSEYKNYLSLANAYELALVAQVDKAGESAMQAYSQAVTLYPNNPQTLVSQARLLQTMGKTDEAEKLYDQAISIKPDFALAYFSKSQLAASQKSTNKAVSFAQSAATYEPNNVQYQLQLGLLQYNDGKYDQAKEALMQAYAFDSENPMVGYYLAQTLYVIDEKEEAAGVVAKLRAAYPDNQEIKRLEGLLTGVSAAPLIPSGDALKEVEATQTASTVYPKKSN